MMPAFPPADPGAVPAPIWLLKVLLYVTFLIHVILMNLTVGGTILTAVFSFKGKAKHLDVAGHLARALPSLMAFTITFGVAPLLFIQVLYGPLVYTSAILMGTPFLLIIPSVLMAYSLMYFMAAKWDRLGRLRGFLALLIFCSLGFVGFTYTNVFTLMLEPLRFHDKYLAHPGGWQMNLVEPTIIPRFLHMMLGAIAVGGLWVAIAGMRRLKMEPEQGRWQYRSGATWFAGATLVNMAVGVWWLLGIPREDMMIFMGGNLLATIAFVVGLVSALAAFSLALMGINSMKPKPLLMGSVHALLLTLASMVVMRDTVRDAELKPDYDLSKLHVVPQWGAILLFVLLFAAGVAAAVWLLRLAAKAKPPSGDEDVNRGPGLTDSGLRKLSPSDSGTYRGGLTDSGSRKTPPSQSGPHRTDKS